MEGLIVSLIRELIARSRSSCPKCSNAAYSVRTRPSVPSANSYSPARSFTAVDYRLSPETIFPGALLDAVNAYLYLTQRESTLSLSPPPHDAFMY
jgi:hypothetical protein